MLKITFLAAALALATGAQAQRLLAARVETPSGTQSGFIRNFSTEITPQAFSFTTTGAGPFTDLTPATASRVELADGTTFERRAIRVAVMGLNELNRDKGSYKPEVYLEGGVFVEKLVAGAVSLYRFEDTYEVSHFFVTEGTDTALTALPYEPYVDEKGLIQGTTDFRNIISRIAITGGCGESISEAIAETRYESRPLIRLVQKVNACRGATGTVTGALNKRRMIVHVGPQVAATVFARQGSIDFYGEKAEGKGQMTRFSFGGFIEFQGSKFGSATVTSVAVTYGTLGYDVNYPIVNNRPFYNVVQLTEKVRVPCLAIEPSVRRMFGKTELRPFGELAAALRFRLADNSTVVTTYGNGDKEETANVSRRSAPWDFLLGAGLQYRQASLGIRYGRSIFGNTVNVFSTTLRFRVL
ncbi:MAG: hypothetical protein EOO16_04060 [Chitinophagaceae bacterium]|nr:MAG: hypothetical protein EOO16_04060 [Chitinophagaceae bacterium]